MTAEKDRYEVDDLPEPEGAPAPVDEDDDGADDAVPSDGDED